MDIYTIDLETYYSKEFSLSKITTEHYVRDDRFETIGLAIKKNDGPPEWFSGTDEQVKNFLKTYDFTHAAICCHNTAFDGAILSWRYNITPKLWLDTMSMARPKHASSIGVSLRALSRHYDIGTKGTEIVNALGKRRADFSPQELSAYGSYCCNDADLTWDLFKILRAGFPASELLTIDTTIRMFTHPSLVLDKAKLEEHLAWEQARKQAVWDKLGGEDVIRPVINSNPKFATLLKLLNVEPPKKTSKATGKETYAFAKTDAGLLALLEHPHAGVRTLVGARLGTKSSIEETRTQSFMAIAERGPLPIMLNYWGAHTGRASGGDKVNLQNLPRGGALRKSIQAKPGHMLVACDLSQIEARVLACIAEQNDLLDAFREGRDVYSEFASDVYGRPITKADELERHVGKTCVLGMGYQVGPDRFREALAIGQGGKRIVIDANEAKRIVYLYRNKNHRIVSLWSAAAHMLNDMHAGSSGELCSCVSYDDKGMLFPNGIRLDYNGLELDTEGKNYKYINNGRAHARDPENGWTHIYGGKVVENVVQRLARDIIMEMMNTIAMRYQVVLQVHDEIVCHVPENEAAACAGFMHKAMTRPPKWLPTLPVACEYKVAANYGDAK